MTKRDTVMDYGQSMPPEKRAAFYMAVQELVEEVRAESSIAAFNDVYLYATGLSFMTVNRVADYVSNRIKIELEERNA